MGQTSILVVEDEPRVADALCRVLSLPQGGGYRVTTCDSGEAALVKLGETHFDLLITDLHMPGMSGLELLERARQISPAIRSVLITAFGSPEVESRAQHLANVYLPKPFDWRKFVQAVQRALSTPPASASQLVVLSEEGLRAIRQRMETLRVDTEATSILLPDWSGHLLAECGQPGEEVDIATLVTMSGNSMAAATAMTRLLNESDGFYMQVHGREHFEVYAATVSQSVFLLLLIDRRMGGNRVGLISLYMRRAIEDLRDLLAGAAIEPGAAPGLRGSVTTAMTKALEEAIGFPLAGDEGATPGELPDGHPLGHYDQSDLGEGTSYPAGFGAATSSETESRPLLTFEQAYAMGLVNRGGPEAPVATGLPGGANG